MSFAQFVVTQDGWCGLCYEHSAAEGIVVIQLVEQVLLQLSEQQETPVESLTETDEDEDSKGDDSNSKSRELVKLEWKVTPVITRRIQESSDNMDR